MTASPPSCVRSWHPAAVASQDCEWASHVVSYRITYHSEAQSPRQAPQILQSCQMPVSGSNLAARRRRAKSKECRSLALSRCAASSVASKNCRSLSQAVDGDRPRAAETGSQVQPPCGADSSALRTLEHCQLYRTFRANMTASHFEASGGGKGFQHFDKRQHSKLSGVVEFAKDLCHWRIWFTWAVECILSGPSTNKPERVLGVQSGTLWLGNTNDGRCAGAAHLAKAVSYGQIQTPIKFSGEGSSSKRF